MTSSTGSESDQRFETAWQSSVLPVLASIESKRRRVRQNILLGWLAVLVPGVPLIVWLHRVARNSDWVAMAITGVIIGVAIVWAAFYLKFRDNFKRALVGPLIKAFDQRLSYSPNDSISREEFEQSGIVREFSIAEFGGEDLIQGKIGKTAVRFSEVSAIHRSESSNRDKRKTVFRGVFFAADFNKHFAGKTYVLPDRAQRFLGGIGQSLQGLRSAYGELVTLEDPEFERLFVVYGSDQVEARYILSASLMARLTDFRQRHGHLIRVAFVDSHLYLGIHIRRNLFEPRIFRSLQDPKLYREFWNDLVFFVSIVEELNLNTRIWTKA